MSRFVLTAQLQLQAPRNVRQVANQIQRQLGSVSVDLNIQNGRQATQQLGQINQQVDNLNKTSDKLGKTFAVSVRRFAAFSIVSRGIGLFTNKLSAAVEESIDFQRELIKIKQVSGATEQALTNLSSTITRLSTDLGTSSKDLLATSRILAQTGLAAAQLETALTALAKTTLAPTFENIEKTAEGAVAILSQFGQGVGALETQLGAINAVAGQFAVESGDLISAVRRTGGVFKAAGGELNDLLALFTSVRATTRESSESIATGLRTIFTRIQRPATIEFMKQFGVELVDLEGKFIGPFEAVRQLSTALKGLEEGDIRFVQIAEELGGFRQIGKVIPLIQQFEVAERARQAAIAGASSLEKDATTAQEALAVQIEKTRQNFLALIRSISETTSFSVLVKTTLGLADALIKVADALKPIVPLMAAFAGIKIAKGLGSFAGGLRGGVTTRNAGGPIGFATGGVVPGTGNRDTVPAMLTPGEFVIRKSSVNKIGAGTLAAMNENRYAQGGKVSDFAGAREYVKRNQETFYKGSDQQFLRSPSNSRFATKFNEDDKFTFNLKRIPINIDDPEFAKDRKTYNFTYNKYRNEKNPRVRGILFEKFLKQSSVISGASTESGSDATSSRLDGIYKGMLAEVKSTKTETTDKAIGEKVIGGAISPKSFNVDQKLSDILTAKTLNTNANTMDFGDIVLLQDVREGLGKFFGGNIPKYATGGPAPSDTVPALLTPGEFVINKGAASRIGRANLDTMNKKGVAGFATGGAVGHVQRFGNGGGVNPAAIAFLLPTILDSLVGTVEKTDDEITRLGVTSFSLRDAFSEGITQFTILGTLATAVGVKLSDIPKIIKREFKGEGPIKGRIKSVTDRFESDFNMEKNRPQFSAFEKFNKTPKRSGLGGTLGRLAGRGGASGAVAEFAKGGLTKTLGVISKFAGPVAIASTALFGLNKIIGAGLGLQEKYNVAIKRGNIGKAQELAVLKEVPSVVALFGSTVSEAYVSLLSNFGGNSLESIRDNAKAQALAGKTTREFEKNSKEAAEALNDLKSGVLTAEEVFKSGRLTKNLENTINQGAAEIKAANSTFLSETNRFASTVRNAFAALTGIGRTDVEVERGALEKKREAEQKAIDATSKSIDELQESIRIWNEQTILGGGTFTDVINTLESQVGGFQGTLSADKLESLGQAFINQQKNIIQTIKIARALNSDLFVLDSTVKGLNASLDDNINKIKGDFDGFSSAINKLEVALEGGRFSNEDFSKSLSSITSTLESFGASDESIKGTIDKFRDLSIITSTLADTINEQRASDPVGLASNPQNFQKQLAEGLANKLQDGSKLKQILSGPDAEKIFEGVDFSNLGQDISEQVNQIIKNITEGSTPDLELFKRLNSVLVKQAKITELVFEAEQKQLNAKLNSIQAEEQSAKILEEFGVSTFTVAKRLKILQKGIDEGIGKGVTSSGESLSAAIANTSEEIVKQKRTLANGDEIQNKDAAARTKTEIKRQEDILSRISSTISSRLDIEREALKLAKEKIKLDKEAINNLISGDIEGFLQKQESAAARRTLLSGNTAATQAFSQTAILEAIQSISSPDERRRAADEAVRSGQISRSQADILTDNTTEIKEIRSNVQELTKAQEDAALAQQKIADTELNIAESEKSDSQKSVSEAVASIAASIQTSNAVNEKLDQSIPALETSLQENTDAIRKLTEQLRQEEVKEEIKTRSEEVDRQIREGQFEMGVDGTVGTIGANIQARGQAASGTILPARTSQGMDVGGQSIRSEMTKVFFKTILDRATFGQFNKYLFARGGSVPIYASRGRSIFKPRGTDTVPAMLTPGEYVVNRKGVDRGDNRQVIEAMNRGATFTNGVYNNEGGGGSMGIDTTALQNIASTLSTSFNKFNETVNRLINFKFEMTIAPTRVDVVLNTPQAMQQMNTAAKEEILNAVVNEISINQLGKLRRNRNA